MSAPIRLECVRCGTPADGVPLGSGCPACAAAGRPANLTTVYDLDRAARELRAAIDEDRRGPGRYAALLPIGERELVSDDVGPTPLLPAPRLTSAVDVAQVWIKDESRGPTWSFKDRAAAIAAAHARSRGMEAIVAASTGNAAAATAAHAHRAGLVPVILFAQGVDRLMASFVRSYGARTFLTGSKEERWALMRECVERFAWYPSSNYSNPPIGNNPWALDGYKAIGYEIWEQLGGRVPAYVYFAVCYGDALFGVWKAFRELQGMGFTDSTPRLGGGEIYGSLERALESGAEVVERAEIDHRTIAFSISAPQSTYQALHAVRGSGGLVSRVSEEQLLEAQRLCVECEGLLVETASAAALAALLRHRREGLLPEDAEVVLVSSSAGMKSLEATGFEDELLPLAGDADELLSAVERIPGAAA